MTIHVNQLIELLATLSEKKDLKATGYEVVKGGVITGFSAVLGGLLLGPVGLAVGGALGGLGSSLLSDDFKPVASVLRDLSAAEKRKLIVYLKNAFRDVDFEDVATLNMLLLSNTSFQERVIAHLSSYLVKEMKMRIKS